MPGPKPKRTTLNEVARAAGVSLATASMVLSGKGDGARIAPLTAERVRSAASLLDYSPNLLVQSIQKGRSGVLAFFSAFRNFEDGDLYMDRLSRGLEQASGARGLDLLIQCAFDRTVEESYRSINGGRADGLLLFAPHAEDPMLAMMRRSRLPCVVLNARDAEGVLRSVKDDVEGAMAEIARALQSLGHRKIACLHLGPKVTPDAEERIGLLRRAYPDLESIDVSIGLDQTLRRVSARPSPASALFCCTDGLAYVVLAAVEQLGLAVPGDISIVGYDGIRWPSDSAHVVASAAVDLKILASAAVDLLLEPTDGVSEVVVQTLFRPGTTLGPASTLQRSIK